MSTFIAVDPTSGEEVRRVPGHNEAQVEARLAGAHAAQREFARLPAEARADRLRKLAVVLRERRVELATLMAQEMGKPLPEGLAEVEKCAITAEYFAEHGPAALGLRPIATEARTSGYRLDPLGLILAIMPWNFPFWQVIRVAVPALLLGNGVVVKHAPRVPGCALVLESLFKQAGFPEHLVALLLVDESVVGDRIGDPRVAAVTFTGSGRGGQVVAQLAGRHRKKAVLELGGSDPFIVLRDADLPAASAAAATSRLQNTGQSCLAAKRFIVEEPVAEDFIDRFLAALAGARLGNPLDPGTRLGPLAREDLRATLHRQVQSSVARGASLVLGGSIPEGRGYFYPPTALLDCAPGMPAWDDETFGPVAAIRVVRDAEEAVQIANASRYGLGATVFSGDPERALALVPRLDAGSVFINTILRSDPRLPFGGIKDSGHGRELSLQALHEFANVKTVYVA